MNTCHTLKTIFTASVMIRDGTRYLVLEVASGGEALKLGCMLSKMTERKDIDAILHKFGPTAFFDLCLTSSKGHTDYESWYDRMPGDVEVYSPEEALKYGFTHDQMDQDFSSNYGEHQNIPSLTWQGITKQHIDHNEFNYLFDGKEWLYILDSDNAVEIEDAVTIPLRDFVALSVLEKLEGMERGLDLGQALEHAKFSDDDIFSLLDVFENLDETRKRYVYAHLFLDKEKIEAFFCYALALKTKKNLEEEQLISEKGLLAPQRVKIM